MLKPVIMAGGSGTRLWPLSREMYSKQFLALTNSRTMLQNTVGRLQGCQAEAPITICNEEHRFMVAEQLREIDVSGSIILEPVGRNTAPAIALAALSVTRDNQDAVLLVLAADHVIQDEAAFQDAINRAVPLAEQGKLVTFGVVPTCAHTGYGYIRAGGELPEGHGFAVESFVEKPDSVTAAEYLESGDYSWNSGIFMFKASRYLEELQKYQPEVLAACDRALTNTSRDLDFIRVDAEAFTACPGVSVDYAVMEHTHDAVVIPVDIGWNDIGSWSALWDVGEKGEHGNSSRGDVILEDTRNCLVHAGDRLVATLGLDDMIIVDTKDAVLIAARDKVQDVKKIVQQLKDSNRSEFYQHREVYRPWGKFDCIDHGHRYQVKRITVKPGSRLSLQMHHHRAEHWIVVSGTARVTIGENTFFVTENESTYIPIGAIHTLENPGMVPLEMIEVQSGTYLGEDDIVRLDDDFGRA